MANNSYKPLTLLAAIMLWTSFLQAQESFNTSGCDATGSGGSVTFSVGQILFSTYTGSSGMVAQGVQQSYEISTVGIKETKPGITLMFFPNPTADHLTIEIGNFYPEKLSYQLLDMQGKQLSKGPINEAQTPINMKGYPSATYFIQVTGKQNETMKSFKIMKR